MNIGLGNEYNSDRGSLTFRRIQLIQNNLFDYILHMQYHRSDTNNNKQHSLSLNYSGSL